MTTSSATWNRKGDKTDVSRVRIRDAAARLFRQQGYAAVSLRAIAAASGMKAGSLYYHYESKDQIIVEILDEGILVVHRAVAKATGALPPDATAAELVRAGVVSHLRALLEYTDYTSANVRIYGQVPDEIRAANLAVRRDYEALWDGILARAAERGGAVGGLRPGVDLRAFRLMLIGALNATLEWFDWGRGGIEDLANRYADILLNGLLQTPESPS